MTTRKCGRSLQAYGFLAHIRSRGEEAAAKKKRPGQKARRRVVERTHSWFNRFRSILTRWSKKAENLPGHALLRLRPHRLPRRAIFRISS